MTGSYPIEITDLYLCAAALCLAQFSPWLALFSGATLLWLAWTVVHRRDSLIERGERDKIWQPDTLTEKP